eukprot:6472802-Amphidinium_carterae.2
MVSNSFPFGWMRDATSLTRETSTPELLTHPGHLSGAHGVSSTFHVEWFGPCVRSSVPVLPLTAERTPQAMLKAGGCRAVEKCISRAKTEHIGRGRACQEASGAIRSATRCSPPRQSVSSFGNADGLPLGARTD